ncbi:MAG TPA: excalibur calcium-binding domain-containing protein [Rhizomicrobium sp.]|nr:excalibur calcium-binding domain-containing protein [Rhizomicrobium sp.]
MTFRTRAFMLESASGPLSTHYSDSDATGRCLRNRFARVTRNAWRRDRLRREAVTAVRVTALLAFVTLPVSLVMTANGWPVGLALRHFAAAFNCDAARSVGLAPARRGEPGYWPWLDRHQDGIACEPRRLTAARN